MCKVLYEGECHGHAFFSQFLILDDRYPVKLGVRVETACFPSTRSQTKMSALDTHGLPLILFSAQSCTVSWWKTSFKCLAWLRRQLISSLLLEAQLPRHISYPLPENNNNNNSKQTKKSKTKTKRKHLTSLSWLLSVSHHSHGTTDTEFSLLGLMVPPASCTG